LPSKRKHEDDSDDSDESSGDDQDELDVWTCLVFVTFEMHYIKL
jgi:hypothetical protein